MALAHGDALQDEIQVVVTKCNLEETGDCRSLKMFFGKTRRKKKRPSLKAHHGSPSDREAS